MEPIGTTIEKRLAALERNARTWKTVSCMFFLLMLCSLLVGATDSPRDLTVNKLIAKEIQVFDGNPDRGILLANNPEGSTIVVMSKNGLSSVMIAADRVNGENVANVATIATLKEGDIPAGANISAINRKGLMSSFDSDGKTQKTVFDSTKSAR